MISCLGEDLQMSFTAVAVIQVLSQDAENKTLLYNMVIKNYSQVLNFENLSWTTASSRLYLSPSTLALKIPACKGRCLVPWGKNLLLIGGRISLPSVWDFDAETETWSLMEARGSCPHDRNK
ncbi:unnamed protein product [Lactuca virosa]|uniref:Uncharacterized protein n=1 Tax=Lactuca virosa TaxID=75947 RepID=A0AAU9P9R8_9ASTR|nr:unnamed protein product [Lactuca virosa]